MDLAACYPPEAGVVSWVRTVRLVRGSHAEVSDAFRLEGPADSIVMHLMTPCDVSKVSEGELRDVETGTRVGLSYDPTPARVQVEHVELDDAKLVEMWGPRVHRVLVEFQVDSPQTEGTWRMRFSME
jgi:hypothetical protein